MSDCNNNFWYTYYSDYRSSKVGFIFPPHLFIATVLPRTAFAPGKSLIYLFKLPICLMINNNARILSAKLKLLFLLIYYSTSGFEKNEFFQQTVNSSPFPTLVWKLMTYPFCTVPFDRFFKIKIVSSCEMFMILFNFYLYVNNFVICNKFYYWAISNLRLIHHFQG